ncbi:hypothetical protein Bca4012_082902 [Brassica carinata]
MGDDDDDRKLPPKTTEEIRQKMISSFTTEIESSSRDIATLILEAHQWDIAAAVSAFRNAVVAASDASTVARPNVPNPPRDSRTNLLGVDIPDSSPSPIRLRSPRSPSRASYPPRSTRSNPFSRDAIQQADDDFDDKENDDAMESDEVERAPLSEILSVTPQVIQRTVTIWRNGFTLDDDNTLCTLDDPDNAELLQGIESLDSPRVVDSPGGTRRLIFKLIRRQQEDFREPPKPFQGVGRTLAEPDSVPPAPSDSLTTEATPSIDATAPTTSIKIILADGTPIVSRFNTHNTIRDVRDFIDASTPDAASRDYQLLIMGPPPNPLTTDLDQTIEQAGISNSVLTQKF